MALQVPIHTSSLSGLPQVNLNVISDFNLSFKLNFTGSASGTGNFSLT